MTRQLPPSVQAVIGGESNRTPRRPKSVIPPESEAQFQAVVIELAKTLGWLVFHAHDSRRSQPGFPDLFMVRGNRAIGAELKTMRGKLTFDQTLWLAKMRDARIEAYVWRPDQKQSIVDYLR